MEGGGAGMDNVVICLDYKRRGGACVTQALCQNQ